MVEHRPLLGIFSHLILIAGVAVVALPLYVAFVASTLSFDEVTTPPMPMLPGRHLLDNYAQVLRHAFNGAETARQQRRDQLANLLVER